MTVLKSIQFYQTYIYLRYSQTYTLAIFCSTMKVFLKLEIRNYIKIHCVQIIPCKTTFFTIVLSTWVSNISRATVYRWYKSLTVEMYLSVFWKSKINCHSRKHFALNNMHHRRCSIHIQRFGWYCWHLIDSCS